jgi:hypothetical protein
MTRMRAALLGLSLIVGLGVYGWAQTPAPPDLSGTDVGFKVERADGNKAVGRLMVRINGKWLDAEISSRGGVVPLQSK